MLKLHKFNAAWGLPDISPFCMKVETYLRMTGLPFESVVADSRKAPKGKLPYIDHDGTVIADSREIIAHLEARSQAPLDAGMSAADRAIATAFRGLLEEEMYYLVIHQRWKQDSGWSLYVPTLKQYARQIGVPAPVTPLLVPLVRRQVVKALDGQGIGRHTPDEVERRACEVIEAVATQLGDGPYFLGSQPRTIDATVYGFFRALMGGPFRSRCKELALSKDNLRAYVERIGSQYYADAAPTAVA